MSIRVLLWPCMDMLKYSSNVCVCLFVHVASCGMARRQLERRFARAEEGQVAHGVGTGC
jgi:hypothetical protein